MKPLVSRDATASLTVAWVRSNSLASWLTRRRSTSWKSRYIKNWAWMGLRSCSHASSRSRTRKTCESLSSAATILASTSSCCAPRSKTNPKLEVSVLDVGIAQQRHLEDHGLEPRLVHLVHVLRAMSLFSQKRLDGGRDRKDERDHIAQPDVIRRLVSLIGLVLLVPCVAQRYLLLVVEPLLVVRTPASVEYPLPEPPAHAPEILRVRLAVRV